MEAHETFGIIKAAYTSPARSAELVLEIPEALKYRRLYGAIYFFGGVLTGRASASVSLDTDSARGSAGSWLWEWGFPGVILGNPGGPLRFPARGDNRMVVLPPFSVEKVQPGEEKQWLDSSHLGRDCMTAVVGDSDFPASFNVVMHPIPFFSSATRIRASISAEWTVDGGTFTEQGAFLIVGCRSSIIPVS